MTSRRNNEGSTKLQNKRVHDSEEDQITSAENAPPAKRAKTTASDKPQPLTAESLTQHTLSEGQLDILDLMELEANKGPGSKGSKRSAASISEVGVRSMASASRDQETSSQATKKSSFTAALYRNTILKGSNIRFQFRPPPEDIQTQITTIIQHGISPERKEELSLIGQKFYDNFVDVLDTAAREDDCVELFYQALSSMGYNESLKVSRKADWQPSLKPPTRGRRFNFSRFNRSEEEANESVEQPSKRRQGGEAYPSPNTSGVLVPAGLMQPLPIPQPEVKTPRPDISFGLKDTAVLKGMQLQGLTELEAKDLLDELAMPDPENGGMPQLCSEPTQASLQMRFPFFLVEGKSYATCRTIYEAQNQAAVSGACSLKILHDLDNLVRKSDLGSCSKSPIVFSVCTEGPIHQIWVHYTTVEDGHGERIYYMAQIKTCDVGIPADVPGFIEAVDNVMRWGSSEHKKTITERLTKLMKFCT